MGAQSSIRPSLRDIPVSPFSSSNPPPTAEVEQSFSLMKLIDTRLRCHLSQKKRARWMYIYKFSELLEPDYQAIFQSWMDAESSKSGQRKVASRL